MKLGTVALGLILALGTATAGAAGAGTVTLGSYTLSDTSFGSGYGVHADGTQSGGSILAYVNQDGSAVTFTSDDALSWTGSGEAILNGPFDDLNVAFAKSWSEITFAFDAGAQPADMALAINGAPVFDAADCSICTLSKNGEQKFTVTGSAIDALAFTFTDAPGAAQDIVNAKQFRVDGAVTGGGGQGGGAGGGPVGGGGRGVGGGLGGGVGGGVGGVPGVPEPASWALMVLGVGLTGFAARRRRAVAALVA